MIDLSPSFSEIETQITVLLKGSGLNPEILALKNCTQGRNNRTYRIETAEGPYIVKQYLRQVGDTRDRLASEFSFLKYAKQVAPSQVPRPFYQDLKMGMALYEYMEGEPLRAEDISAKEVRQAAQFFCALNEPSTKTQALSLPAASEACFSIQEHLDLISGRIEQLKNLKPDSDEDLAASQLVLRLTAFWRNFIDNLRKKTKSEALDFNAFLDLSQRCISPSDFGFHNALKQAKQDLCFLDFEYAGWDDPAKMTGDFFSQLALPVPEHLFKSFVEQVMSVFSQPEILIHRAHLLRLVYRVKWCCIALNIFLPVHLARYRFSNPSLAVSDFKRGQLAKVTTLIQSLESHTHGLY